MGSPTSTALLRRIFRSSRSATLNLLIIAALFSSVSLQPREARARQVITTLGVAGDLDPSFGNGGKVVTDFSGSDDEATAVAIQADDHIVVGGTSTPRGGHPDFALARYNPDGSLDLSFGVNGRVTTDFLGDKDFLRAIAIQTDGRIVAAGSASQPGVGPVFGLARYNPDGSLDTTFGSSGKATTSFSGNDDEASGVALTTTGKILAVGTANFDTFPKFALARYNPDGSLDTTFGANGKVINSISGGPDIARAVVLQTDNKIVIAGHDFPSKRFAVFRYNEDGSPDNTFGKSGGVTTEVSLFSAATSVALQTDGKIVTAGAAEADILKVFFGLARYNIDGSLDSGFGFFFGTLGTSITNRNDVATALGIQKNDKILAAGYAGAPNEVLSGSADFAVVRYKRNGKLDSTFGIQGKVLTDFFGKSDQANAMALQPDGKIVLAGVAQSATNAFAIARYLVEDFSLGFEQTMISVGRGSKVSVDVLISHIAGFTGSVTVTAPELSAIGVKVKPANSITTTHAKVTLRFKIKSTAQIGEHQLTFRAQDDEGRVRTAILNLNIL